VLCKTCTDRELVYKTKGRIFNNMLYMRYVLLAKGQVCSQETNRFSCQRGCYIRTMTAKVQLKKKKIETLVVSLYKLGAKMYWLAVNRQSWSNANFGCLTWRQTCRLTMGHNITLTLTFSWVSVSSNSQCTGRFEYLHHSLESCGRWRKGNPVPRGITGLPCAWGNIKWGPGTPGCESLQRDSKLW
jgi:hypothetical protein